MPKGRLVETVHDLQEQLKQFPSETKLFGTWEGQTEVLIYVYTHENGRLVLDLDDCNYQATFQGLKCDKCSEHARQVTGNGNNCRHHMEEYELFWKDDRFQDIPSENWPKLLVWLGEQVDIIFLKHLKVKPSETLLGPEKHAEQLYFALSLKRHLRLEDFVSGELTDGCVSLAKMIRTLGENYAFKSSDLPASGTGTLAILTKFGLRCIMVYSGKDQAHLFSVDCFAARNDG